MRILRILLLQVTVLTLLVACGSLIDACARALVAIQLRSVLPFSALAVVWAGGHVALVVASFLVVFHAAPLSYWIIRGQRSRDFEQRLMLLAVSEVALLGAVALVALGSLIFSTHPQPAYPM